MGFADGGLGSPEYIDIQGIMDGKVLNYVALEEAARALSACGLGTFHFRVEAGRWSIIPDLTQVKLTGFTDQSRAAIEYAMTAIGAATVPGTLESTMRFRVVYTMNVVECVCVARPNGLEFVSRSRERQPGDSLGEPVPEGFQALVKNRSRLLLLVIPLLLVAGTVTMWTSGYLDRILSAGVDSLQLDSAEFKGMLSIEVSASWGNYAIVIRRSPDGPKTPEDFRQLKEEKTSDIERAAVDAVEKGDDIWIALVNKDGDPLSVSRVDLASLLKGDDAKSKTVLRGRIGGERIVLSKAMPQEHEKK